jgi:hypothetical protein
MIAFWQISTKSQGNAEMNINTRILVVLTFALSFSLTFGVPSPAAAAAPLELSGEINGAPFRIRVPETWNGTLLIFAHGYRDKADHPGEIDDRSADVAPSAALEAPLLAQGFALAGSAYKDNGWAFGDAIHDIKDLAVFFRENVISRLKSSRSYCPNSAMSQTFRSSNSSDW